jgi:hypothetical protein
MKRLFEAPWVWKRRHLFFINLIALGFVIIDRESMIDNRFPLPSSTMLLLAFAVTPESYDQTNCFFVFSVSKKNNNNFFY